MVSRLVLTVLFLALGQSVSAADITVEPNPGGPALIRVTGPIVQEDAAKFEGIASGYTSAFVVFDSHGGSVYAALKMGTLIREKRFTTLVGSDTVCASACALAWLGGTTRFMAANAHIGFHAAFMDQNGNKVTVGFGNAMIGAYLAKLGLPDQAIYYVTQAPPDDITWLSYDEAPGKGIAVRLFPTNPALASVRPAPPVAHQLAQNSPAQANTPSANPSQSDENLVQIAAKTFAQNYRANGISGVIAATQACYHHSETTTESARVCILYDVVGYRVDRGYTEALGNPSLRQPYYSDEAFNDRIKHYAQAVFGGWNVQANNFLTLSDQIVSQAPQQ